ncbi:MAG: hypothetical protein KJ645_07810, partial [Planctomycetes bacterium]|nr:hypothetical protein [Planctomycetota bacterium]
ADASAEILLLAVKPAFCNMELESRLLARLQADLLLQGVKHVRHVLENNDRNRIGVFQKEGFQLDGLKRRVQDSLTINLSKSLINESGTEPE